MITLIPGNSKSAKQHNAEFLRRLKEWSEEPTDPDAPGLIQRIDQILGNQRGANNT